jgi:CDP-glucose 4,6-dehydratase
VRNPAAVRPWQHVLDPLMGYLALAERLLEGTTGCAEAFNFGPPPTHNVPVSAIVDRLVALWGAGARWEQDPGSHPHEAAMLTLDSSKAAARLGWRPTIDLDRALDMTVAWYKDCRDGADMRERTINQIDSVLARSGEE